MSILVESSSPTVKQIGVNQFHGFGAGEAAAVAQLNKVFARRRSDEKFEVRDLVPSTRFSRLAKQRLHQPFASKWPHFYQVEQSLIEMDKVDDECWPDIEGASDFVWHLRSLYVVDSERGNGIGRRVIEKIKEIAEDAEAIVVLFVAKFGFAKDGISPSAFTSMKELIHASLIEHWKVTYFPDYENELVEHFYLSCGLKNCCLANECSRYGEKSGEHWREHFCYVPSSVSPDHLARFQHRLNPELCDLCR